MFFSQFIYFNPENGQFWDWPPTCNFSNYMQHVIDQKSYHAGNSWEIRLDHIEVQGDIPKSLARDNHWTFTYLFKLAILCGKERQDLKEIFFTIIWLIRVHGLILDIQHKVIQKIKRHESLKSLEKTKTYIKMRKWSKERREALLELQDKHESLLQ